VSRAAVRYNPLLLHTNTQGIITTFVTIPAVIQRYFKR